MARVTAFIVFELLKENQQGKWVGVILPKFRLRYSNIDFVSVHFFFSLRKISMAVKIFVLNRVVNSFSPFHVSVFLE